MARAYGNDRATTIAVRLTEQEKEQIKAAAKARTVSISDLVRVAIEEYLLKGENTDGNCI